MHTDTPLRRVLHERRIQVVEVARLAGVTRERVQVALRGEAVSRRTADAIAKVTGLDPLVLVGRRRW